MEHLNALLTLSSPRRKHEHHSLNICYTANEWTKKLEQVRVGVWKTASKCLAHVFATCVVFCRFPCKTWIIAAIFNPITTNWVIFATCSITAYSTVLIVCALAYFSFINVVVHLCFLFSFFSSFALYVTHVMRAFWFMLMIICIMKVCFSVSVHTSFSHFIIVIHTVPKRTNCFWLIDDSDKWILQLHQMCMWIF